MSNASKVYDAAMRRYQAAIIDEEAAYRKAEIEGDIDAATEASLNIANYRAQASEYQKMATEHARSLNPQSAPMAGGDELSYRDQKLARQYGMDAATFAIAKNWTSDPNLSDEDKVKTYAEQRQRYQQARADGSYRDDQGTVKR